MRCSSLIAGFASLALAGAMAQPLMANATTDADSTPTVLELPGNPSTGYRWIVDEEASTGLDHVTIEDLGYGEPAKPMPGAPAPFRFQVTCTSPGTVEISFDYLSPDKTTVGQTATHQMDCY